MIFGRKKKKAAEATDETEVTTAAEVDEDAVVEAADDPATDDPATDDSPADDLDVAVGAAETENDADADRWTAYDLSRDWREDGPFDFEEVDLEADEVTRLDFGSLIVTPLPDCEIRLQVAPDTQSIMSILMVVGDSAMEVAAFAAPRTPGMWAEIREQIRDETRAAGGTAEFVQGPFGTEVVRSVRLQAPDGQIFEQDSRTWAAEGPRWLLRGVLVGRIALPNAPDDLVGPFLDAFADLVVRRGDQPMPMGDTLPLTLPEGAIQQAPPQS